MKDKINEALDVVLYKKLLRTLGDYTNSFPATGVDKLFQAAVKHGIKIMPKDKYALAILDTVLCDMVPTAVQKLLNIRFSDLEVGVRPLHVSGRRHLVAFWNRDNNVHDKVRDLIDFAGTGKAGGWSEMNGDKVTLIDMTINNGNKESK